MKFKYLFGFSFLITLFMSVIVLNTNTYAVSGTCFFAGGTCSVSGEGDYITNDVLVGQDRSTTPITPAIDSSIANKNDFVYDIATNRYRNGSEHDKKGAEFIMRQMLGMTASDPNFSVELWESVMMSDNNISATRTDVTYSSSFTTSYWDDVKGDAFYASHSATSRNVIQVWYTDPSSGSILIATIETLCGNLVSQALPFIVTTTADVYSIDGDSSNTSMAKIGQEIIWHYTATVNISNTTKNVGYGYDNKGTGSSSGFTSSKQIGTIMSGVAAGTVIDSDSSPYGFYQKYTVPASSKPGDELCSSAYVNPASSFNNSKQNSAPACVSIETVPTPVPPSNKCRPIQITVKPRSYPAVSHTAPDGSYYSDPGGVVPIKLSINGASVGASSYSVETTIDQDLVTNYLTTKYTTGDNYTVDIKETRNHVSGYTDVYRTESYSCGKKTCHRQVYDHTRTNYSGPNSWTTSFGPCYDYKLSSSINNFFARLEPGSSITVIPTITNSTYTGSAVGKLTWASFYNYYHPHSKSKTTEWRITKMIIAPSATATPSSPPSAVAGGTSGTYGMSFCGRFDPTGKSTCSTFSGTTVFDVSGNPSSSIDYDFTVPDIAAGTKICFAFSIYPSQSDPLNTSSSPGGSDLWNHAGYDPARNCIVVVKKPKTQIWGGDLWTANSVNASNSVKSGYRFGSWGEYGVLAPGSISGIASGSAFASVSGSSSGTCGYNTLTFTNGANAACSSLGNYSAHTMPSVEANFPGGTAITPDASGSITVDTYFHN